MDDDHDGAEGFERAGAPCPGVPVNHLPFARFAINGGSANGDGEIRRSHIVLPPPTTATPTDVTPYYFQASLSAFSRPANVASPPLPTDTPSYHPPPPLLPVAPLANPAWTTTPHGESTARPAGRSPIAPGQDLDAGDWTAWSGGAVETEDGSRIFSDAYHLSRPVLPPLPPSDPVHKVAGPSSHGTWPASQSPSWTAAPPTLHPSSRSASPTLSAHETVSGVPSMAIQSTAQRTLYSPPCPAASYPCSGEAPIKAKRKRATPEQVTVLTSAFERNPFPSIEERAELAERVGMSVHQIRIWMQNRRQSHRNAGRTPAGQGAAQASGALGDSDTAQVYRPSVLYTSAPLDTNYPPDPDDSAGAGSETPSPRDEEGSNGQMD